MSHVVAWPYFVGPGIGGRNLNFLNVRQSEAALHPEPSFRRKNSRSRFKQWRGVATRYAKQAASFLANRQIRAIRFGPK